MSHHYDLTEQGRETLHALCKQTESAFPTSTDIPPDSWQVLLLSSLVAGGRPELAKEFYLYLIATPKYATSEQRQGLIKRLRECLVKLVSIVGVVRPLEAIFGIAGLEKEEDREYSFSREHWSSGPSNLQRGRSWLDQIYLHNHASTENTLACHKDFEFISLEITYGLYLSDHTILGPVETEIVVLSGIAMQNAPRECGWHLRGLRRIGVGMEDVEKLQQLIEKVAEFCGVRVDRLPRVKDIEHEV